MTSFEGGHANCEGGHANCDSGHANCLSLNALPIPIVGSAGITTTEEDLQMKRFVIGIFVSLFTLFTLSGCETMEGFGRDVEKVGSEIEDKADK